MKYACWLFDGSFQGPAEDLRSIAWDGNETEAPSATEAALAYAQTCYGSGWWAN